VTSSLAAYEAAIWVKSMYMIKYIIENQKKRESMQIKEILHKSPSKRSSANGIHSLLKRADARER